MSVFTNPEKLMPNFGSSFFSWAKPIRGIEIKTTDTNAGTNLFMTLNLNFHLFLSGGNSFFSNDLSCGGLPYNTFRLLSAAGLSFQRVIAFR